MPKQPNYDSCYHGLAACRRLLASAPCCKNKRRAHEPGTIVHDCHALLNEAGFNREGQLPARLREALESTRSAG